MRHGVLVYVNGDAPFTPDVGKKKRTPIKKVFSKKY